MENQKNTSYGQDSHTVENQPWNPQYQNTNLNEEFDDNESHLYPNQNRNQTDKDPSNIGNEEYENDYNDDEDDLDKEPFEEEGDFEEKDIDYREKKERDFLENFYL